MGTPESVFEATKATPYSVPCFDPTAIVYRMIVQAIVSLQILCACQHILLLTVFFLPTFAEKLVTMIIKKLKDTYHKLKQILKIISLIATFLGLVISISFLFK